ncbi:hypothetical protein LDJ79_16240 [Vibrio tritonius]|uniref:Uncharacterized protein n=1 Tax=Vibrio tritonius TaxID=1435069 RepID=A0ABS7YTQ0_9VIBR|nr:hypothetical protein [Vibrio tritonius]MCA2017675.1 hypothetical protein [Vibrio tritonius]
MSILLALGNKRWFASKPCTAGIFAVESLRNKVQSSLTSGHFDCLENRLTLQEMQSIEEHYRFKDYKAIQELFEQYVVLMRLVKQEKNSAKVNCLTGELGVVLSHLEKRL